MSKPVEPFEASSSAGNLLRTTSPLLRVDSDTESNQAPPSALVVLNSPIHCPPSRLFSNLWEQSDFVVCADGGANRLYDATSNLETTTAPGNWKPDLIKGDLDSIRPDVRKFYDELGTEIIQDPDQDSNDLDKSLQAVTERNIRRCCIYGAFGGRFDQEMAAFQALFAWKDRFESMWLYDDQTCAVLLTENVRNEVRIVHPGSIKDSSIPGEGPTCGLIPLCGKVDSLTTTGFRWDLQDHESGFGGLLSTSNHVEEQVVTIKASGPIIFTAEVTSGTTQ